MPIRAVIADDEPAARDAVRTLLAEFTAVEVVGEARTGDETVAVVRRTTPDLLFLDIQMPDRDGFAVLDALGDDVPRGVVFVTAHDEHALRAFEMHALDYVLKPFGRPRFSAAVTRALERIDALDALTLKRTLSSMALDRRTPAVPAGEIAPETDVAGDASPTSPPRRIGVRTGARTILVDVASIDWVDADGDYARIHAGRNSHLVSLRMHALERLLDGADFVRIHRSILVNAARAQELHREPDGSGTLVLTSGVRLRVARARWDALERALGMKRR